MLKLDIKVNEYFDEVEERFVPVFKHLELEHSLLSLSRWEEKYEKPFLTSSEQLTPEEIGDYVKMMVVSDSSDGALLDMLDKTHFEQIQQYLNRANTATTVSDPKQKKQNEKQIITAEVIYYWMFSLRIPKECEEWNLNRLLTLIRVFDAKNSEYNQPVNKKLNKAEIMRQNRRLNAQRLKGGRRG